MGVAKGGDVHGKGRAEIGLAVDNRNIVFRKEITISEYCCKCIALSIFEQIHQPFNNRTNAPLYMIYIIDL